jgi:broad specificity phosphatase PhoE
MMVSSVIALLALQPMEVVFVRHAETVANATGKYNSTTLNAFSERGKKQVSKLTASLQEESFDAIVVSPSPRALKTIAPYLQRTGQKAEIWPELLECCHQRGAARTKPASPQVRFGSKIEWHPSLSGLFTLREDGTRYIDAPTYADGKRQVALAMQRVLKTWSESGKKVLIVGHSIHGGMLLSQLTGGRKFHVQNAVPIWLREVRPGVLEKIESSSDLNWFSPYADPLKFTEVTSDLASLSKKGAFQPARIKSAQSRGPCKEGLVRGKGLEPSRLVGTTTSR